MKIVRTDPLSVPLQHPRQQESATESESDTRLPSQSEARISSTAQSVAHASAGLANTPDVDLEKVHQVRQALIEGRYELDMDALGRAILDLHRP